MATYKPDAYPPSRGGRPTCHAAGRGSKYYYDRGCRCGICTAHSATAKAALRDRRRDERVLDNGNWVHPGLAPITSDLAKRHGTRYGRKEFSCECEYCRDSNRRDGSYGTLVAAHFTIWQVAELCLVIAVIVGVITLWMFRGNRLAAVSQAVEIGCGFGVALFSVAVAAAIRRPPGRHQLRTTP